MTLQISDTGPLPRDCDPDCADIQTSHGVEGVIRFYGTMSNPNAPTGAVTAMGTALYGFGESMGLATVNMEPTVWIDQPDDLGASGLSMTVGCRPGDTPNFNVVGSPTADGCSGMHLAVFPD